MILEICMQVVLVGDSEGEVNVYLLKNMPAPPTDQVLLRYLLSWHNKISVFCI